MIDADVIAPGDWFSTPDGLSVLLVRHRPNVFREEAAPGHVYGPTDRIGLAFKTFCGWNGKPARGRKREGYAAPGGCDPMTDEDHATVIAAREAHPVLWSSFLAITESSLHQPCRLNLATGLDDAADVEDRVARVMPLLECPADGMTLNALSLRFAEVGVTFDYAAAARTTSRMPRAILNVRNIAFRQTEAGENLFFEARIEGK